MNLTTLVQGLWRTSIGRIGAAAVVAAGMASCGVQKNVARNDRTPPCVDLRLYKFNLGQPELSIDATDPVYIGCSRKTKISNGLELMEESEASSANSGLAKIEVYENGRRVTTLRVPNHNSNVQRSLTITSTEGDFTYHAIAYDRAGNKTESVPLRVSFREGFCFPDGLRDTERPEIVGFAYLRTYRSYSDHFVAAVSDDTGLKIVSLYQQDTLIYSERPSAGERFFPTTTIYFTADHRGNPGQTYHLIAEDFAGNVTRTPDIRLSEL